MATETIPTTRPRVTEAARPRAMALAPEWLLAIPFLAPALFFYAVFLLVPLLGTLALSVTDWSGFNIADIEFVGNRQFPRARRRRRRSGNRCGTTCCSSSVRSS